MDRNLCRNMQQQQQCQIISQQQHQQGQGVSKRSVMVHPQQQQPPHHYQHQYHHQPQQHHLQSQHHQHHHHHHHHNNNHQQQHVQQQRNVGIGAAGNQNILPPQPQTPQQKHEDDVVEFVRDLWTKVETSKTLTNFDEIVDYDRIPPNFKPFDLDSLWGRKQFQHINNSRNHH